MSPENGGAYPNGELMNKRRSMMICYNCGRSLKDEELFCMNCGTKVEKTPPRFYCANCGRELHPEGLFCMNCGQKVPE